MAGISTGIPALGDLSLGNAEQPDHVQAVVAWFPPTDFLKMDEQLAQLELGPISGQEHSGAGSPESLLLGAKVTDIPDLIELANPET